MRRSPLPRRTPLSPGQKQLKRTPLVSKTGLEAGKGLRRSELVPKRPKADPAERPARKLLAARSGGICEMDGRNPATDAHHRKNRSQSGRWEITNLLHLCHEHHMHVTVNPALARERGWSVSGTQNPATAPVWIAGRGWTYLRADGSYAPVERTAA